MDKKSFLAYVFSMLLFATNGVLAFHIPLDSYEIVFYRTVLGFLFMAVVCLATHQKFKAFQDRRSFAYTLLAGAANAFSWIFLFEAYEQTGVSMATLIYNCGPVIVIALSPFLFKERMTWIKVAAVAIVLGGMVCLNFDALSSGGFSFGIIVAVLAASMYAILVIFSKKVEDVSGFEVTFWQLLAGSVVVLVYVLLKQGYISPVPAGSCLSVMWLGFINTGFSCLLYFISIKALSATTVSIWSYVQPVGALFFAWLLLGEKLSLIQIIGALLIFAGVTIGTVVKKDNKLARVELPKESS